MKTIALIAAASFAMGCATPKLAASDAFGPTLTIHSLPAGSEILRDGKSLGTAPIEIPIQTGDTTIALQAQRDGYLPAKVELDAAGLRQAGGGETWIALKPVSMGTDTPDLDAQKAQDLDRAGVALSRDKRCPEAMQFFDHAIGVNPGFAKAYKDRAHCDAKQKRFDLAAADLEKYVNTAPDAPDAAKVQQEILKLRAHRDIDLAKFEQDQ